MRLLCGMLRPLYIKPEWRMFYLVSSTFVMTGECICMITTEEIWDSYHEQLKFFVLKHIQEANDADDVLQEAFVKIHMHVATLREEEKLRSWLYQIVRNAIVDYYRQQRHIEPLTDTDIVDENELSFDDAARELAPCIQEMVGQLPEKYRQALLLTEYEGLTQKELSTRLGISFSGAKSRIQRAREQLKDMLLACCNFQFDRLGHIVDYQQKPDCYETGC